MLSDCPHSHSGPIGLTASGWFHARSPSWVSYDCPHSHSGAVGLIACEWFHARSSWVPSDCPHSPLVLLTWQFVSKFMPGPAGCLLTVRLTPTLVTGAVGLSASEWFYAGPAGCLLTVFAPTLVLLVWQEVSAFMPGPSGCLLTVLTPTLILLAWQQVSDFMPGPQVECLMIALTHSHSGPVGLTVCEWFHARSIWMPSDCPHSNPGPVGLTGSEWFYAKFTWMLLLDFIQFATTTLMFACLALQSK